MNSYKITIFGDCGRSISSIDKLAYNPFVVSHYEEFFVDMRKLYFIHPSGVVALLALLERLYESGKEVHLSLPEDAGVRSYFARIGLRAALEELGPIAHPPQALDSITPKVTPILPFLDFLMNGKLTS